MREIKFRAWDKEASRMYHDVGVIPPHYKPARVAEDGKWSLHTNSNSTPLIPYNTQRYELMQYTGLKDKNGVEIYEGDRFLYKTKAGNRGNFVVFKDGAFGANVMRSDLPYLFIPLETFIRRHGVEVVGNIYERQELLEQQ